MQPPRAVERVMRSVRVRHWIGEQSKPTQVGYKPARRSRRVSRLFRLPQGSRALPSEVAGIIDTKRHASMARRHAVVGRKVLGRQPPD